MEAPGRWSCVTPGKRVDVHPLELEVAPSRDTAREHRRLRRAIAAIAVTEAVEETDALVFWASVTQRVGCFATVRCYGPCYGVQRFRRVIPSSQPATSPPRSRSAA